jgi:hypothetical protein
MAAAQGAEAIGRPSLPSRSVTFFVTRHLWTRMTDNRRFTSVKHRGRAAAQAAGKDGTQGAPRPGPSGVAEGNLSQKYPTGIWNGCWR